MNEYQVRVYFASGRMNSSIGTLIKGDYNSSKLVFEFDDDSGIKMFELLKPDGVTKWIKEIVNNEIILADTDELGEIIPLLTQDGTYIFEVAKYDNNGKLTSIKGKFKVKDEQVSTNDIVLEEKSKVELDDLINDVAKVVKVGNEATANTVEQANYAKEQGNYAKEQASKIVDANEQATELIKDFEQKTDSYINDFDLNSESKVNSYNENAANKLKEYNDNATTGLSEYNSNSDTKTEIFNTNVSEKTDAFNLNATKKTDDFNSNAEAKTTEFNDNATTKTEEYNTNAEAKVNEFNATVDELKQDVEDCYNNMLTAEAEGTLIHVEDSANARILSLESEGNSYQETRSGKNLFNEKTENINYYVNPNTGVLVTNEVWNTSDFIEVLPNTAYTLSGNPISSSQFAIIEYDINKNFIQRNTSSNVESAKFTITSTSTTNYIRIAYRNDKITGEVQLEQGTATSYEQYGASPSPDYPQEIEVVEGYNLFDKDNVNVINGVPTNGSIVASTSGKTFYIEVEPNHTYTVNREVVGSRFSIATTKDIPVVGSIISDNIVSNSASSITVTTSNEAKYLLVYYLYNNTEDEEKILSSIQIVKGKEVKPYLPYGCIRNKFVGKNLFDKNNVDIIDAYLSTSNTGYLIKEQNPNMNYTLRIKCNPNTTYTISKIKSTRLRVASYPSLVNEGNLNNGVYNDNGTNVTITTGTEDNYIYLFYWTLNGDTLTSDEILNTIQLEESSVVTEIEPYQENNIDINLQDNFMAKIGDVADTLRVENGRAILTKNIGKVILNGSENWKLSSEGFFIDVQNFNFKNKTLILSDKFENCVNWATINDRDYGIGMLYNNVYNLYIKNIDIATIEEFKAWLQANPVTVYYILATPYEVDLGPVTMPKTYEGITNVCLISNLESNMKLKYVRSTNIVVDNLAKAIVALGGEINV